MSVNQNGGLPKECEYFQEVDMNKIILLPREKPDIEVVSSFTAQPEVVSARLIETPEAVSYEGMYLSGYKLVVELAVRQRVNYVANEPSQPVHSAYYENEMKSAFIIAPKEVDGVDLKEIIRLEQYRLTPYILYRNVKMVNKRAIFKSLMILINLTFCP